MRDIDELRILAVLQIRLDGAELWDVTGYIAEREASGEPPWTVTEGLSPLNAAQIGELVAAADQRIIASTREAAAEPTSTEKHKAKLRGLYARAVQTGDIRTARSLLADLAKLDHIGTTPAEPRPLTRTANPLIIADRRGTP